MFKGFKVVFLLSGKEVQYQWANTPSDGQIEEVVKEFKLFRYEKEIIKVAKGLRDEGWEKYVAWDKSFAMTAIF